MTPSPWPSSTVTPESTATSELAPTSTPPDLAVAVLMPAHDFETGDVCWLSVDIFNPGEVMPNVPVFVVLDVFGEYYMASDGVRFLSGLSRYCVSEGL
jgi:hypothetical protein